MNPLLLSDAYKYSHHKFYHPHTEKIYSYLESRGGMYPETVFFGLQYLLKAYLARPFTADDIDEAEVLMNGIFGRTDVFPRERFEYLLEHHGGFFPIRISAVPEGMVVPLRHVLLTIENTDPRCAWATNFLETLLMQLWYPITVATLSREVRKVARFYLNKTSDNTADDFFLNDFGFRGVSSVESAGIGGAAHLINFSGSDNVYASAFIRRYYNTEKVYGSSIPATEHSICTQQGEEGELAVFRSVLSAYPEGMVACVSDSYDIFRACEKYWGTELRQEVLSRKGVLVIRPDSGDPEQTLLAVFKILFQQFGGTVNSKGYRVLPPQVRVIQGDGIHLDSLRKILETLEQNGIAAENLVAGMGGKLLQGVHRDTLNFAIKCAYTEYDGQGHDVWKSPVEMDANGAVHQSFKTSKRGRLSLHRHTESGEWRTFERARIPQEKGWTPDLLAPVFQNGEILRQTDFEHVRSLAGF